LRITVQSTSTTMIAGESQAGRAGTGRPRHRLISQFSQAAKPMMTAGMAKALSCKASVKSPCRRSCTMRSPPHAGQYRPVSAWNGQAKKTWC
jgi:hypothetical protein